jgi:hypothetical protein
VFRIRVVKLFSMLLLALSHAASADTLHLLRLSTGYFNYQVVGTKYEPADVSDFPLEAEYSLTPPGSAWRFGAQVYGDVSAQFLSLSAGADYHFRPLNTAVIYPLDNVSYQTASVFSPYVGMRLGISRVQISLKKQGTYTSDIVAGALVGPHLRAGTTYSVDQDWKVDVHVYTAYGFSPQIATSIYGLSIGIAYILPD